MLHIYVYSDNIATLSHSRSKRNAAEAEGGGGAAVAAGLAQAAGWAG